MRIPGLMSRGKRPAKQVPPSDPLLMTLSESSLSFSATEGGGAPAAQQITIDSTGTQPAALAGPVVGTITDPDDIIDTAVITGSGPWTLTVTPKEGPGVGGWNASVEITDANATNSPLTISVGQVVQAAGGTTINALVGTFDSTGSGTVSSGFPLIQGQLTDQDVEDKKVVVKVGGTEKACYVEALRGRYPDGSVRSVLIQFVHNTASTSTWEDATVEVGGAVRATTDISKTAITSAFYLEGRRIIPKDVAHTKACWVTFRPILAKDDYTSNHIGHLVNQFENRAGVWGDNGSTQATYQTTYESASGLIAGWQARGSTTAAARAYLWQGQKRAHYHITGYLLPATGTSGFSPHPNENGWPGTATANLAAEWHSQQIWGLASAYLLTGATELWNVICLRCSWGTAGATSAAVVATLGNSRAISPTYLPRFNLTRIHAIMLSAIIDATKQYSGSFGSGVALGGSNAATKLPWWPAAWDTHKHAQGDVRDNFRGSYHGTTDSGGASGYPGTGSFPNFQGALATWALLMWWLNVEASDTIAGYIKTNVDLFIDNNLKAITGQNQNNYNAGARWGNVYWSGPTAGSDGTQNAPFTLPMWADVIAFCGAKYPTEKASKYGPALQKVLHEANMQGDLSGGSLGTNGNLNWGNLTGNWGSYGKLFGEAWGFSMAAPYLDVEGLPGGVPSAIRAPVQY